MVLYKRKPVTNVPVPAKIDNNSEVWVMPKSGEVFTDYESYLSRYEFYNRKKFTDAVNGKSGLTFFAAIDSENNSSSDIEKIFPDALRDPILRKVQFSEISRIDELVSFVFDEFRNDFFPGEEVNVSLDNGDQFEGVIREKAKFPELRNPDGSIQRAAFSRYFVKLNNLLGDEALLDDKHIKRNRKLFTKQNLRSFLKNSLQRAMFNGAPWLVKEHLARQYRLPMEIPAHLHQKMQASPQPGMPRQPQGSSIFNKVNGRKGKNLTIGDFEQEGSQQGFATPPLNGTGFAGYQTIATKSEPPRVIPVPVKYPIEDLDVPLRKNSITRPDLKFISPSNPGEGDVKMEYVGPLLEIWNTLNVHSEVLYLDAFTFDDFLDAMKFSSDEVRCELLEEAHCSVLKTIVADDGTLNVTLPDMAEDESSDEEMDDSEPATPILDAPAHATRSRMSNIEPDESTGRSSRTPAEGRHRPHRTPELLASYGWVERLQARDFPNGGWQTIMAGLLHQLSLNPRQKQECDKILSRLVPLDEEPSQESIRKNYVHLDINLRISALQLITLLAVSTKTVRGYLENMSEEQTRIRKDKLEHQKAKKESVAKLSELETQKKILLPDNLPDSPKEEHPDPMDISVSHIDDTMDTVDIPTSDADEEGGRSLRRGNERKRKREEDAARREKQREEKVKAAKTSSKQSKEFSKLLKDIDKLQIEISKREKEIAICDDNLREANCQRTKVLGRDRFWNRYYWFERNGMPFTGVTDGSTGDYGYANARIWVQGPDEMERLGFIDLPEDLQRTYVHEHGVSVLERKAKEEGATSLRTANEWGYYDDPESINLLLSWFDDRGVREKALRKEMTAWQEPITEQMRTLRTHLDKAKQEEGDDEPVTRVSTRKKTYVDLEASSQRCLRWRNLEALNEFGHLHSEQPKPKEKKGKKEAKGVARVVSAKVVKPSTRQGAKYGK